MESLPRSFKRALPLLLAVLVYKTHAQKSEDSSPQKAIKLNINYVRTASENYSHLGNLAPAFLLSTKRNNFHEVELNSVSLKKERQSLYDQWGGLSDNNVRTIDFGLRYQFTWSILKHEKWMTQLGLSLLTGYSSIHTDPLAANAYDRNWQAINETLTISPQFRYNISKKLLIDLSVPVDLFAVGFTHQKILNPAIPVRQQRNGEVETSWPVEEGILHVRAGFGVRL